jgi:hypothetical protein
VAASTISSFEKYTNKVFQLGNHLDLLQDGREAPKINISRIFMACYYGFSFRLKAINSIEEESRTGILRHRVGAISDDTLKYGLAHLCPESLQALWHILSKRAKRNGMLRNSPFCDYIVGVMDCIEVYNSYNVECAHCLTRRIETTEGDKIQYYHRAVVLTIVGFDFPIPIGLEMMKPGEDEVSCGLRLLKRIVSHLGKRFVDILIGDAGYCTPRFFKQCRKLGIIPGAVLKDNQENLLLSAQAQKKNSEPNIERDGKGERSKVWDLPEVYWYTADEDVRVIYAEREVLEKNYHIVKKKKKKKKRKPSPPSPNKPLQNKDDQKKKGREEKQKLSIKDLIAKTSHLDKKERKRKRAQKKWVKKKRVYVFSKELNHLSLETIYNIGIHRWDIDANLFMDMTQHWHLKHKTLHLENAYENMLRLRLISYTLFMYFFTRLINSRRKNKIHSPLVMARMLYRSACQNLMPEYVLLE